MIKRFHIWQDRLQEPWRMLFTIGMIMVLVVIPIDMGGVGILIGAGIGALLIVSRIAYLDGGPYA